MEGEASGPDPQFRSLVTICDKVFLCEKPAVCHSHFHTQKSTICPVYGRIGVEALAHVGERHPVFASIAVFSYCEYLTKRHRPKKLTVRTLRAGIWAE
jgi:hypothetical protein